MISILFVLMTFYAFADACDPSQRLFSDHEFQVRVSEYVAPKSNKHVLIIPPTGGRNYLDESYAQNLCEAGMTAKILEGWTGDDEYNLELSIHQRFYARALRAVSIVIKNLPPETKIGILGTSVGALHASIAIGLLDRIQTGFFITGGADIAEIIVDSNQEIMKTAREKRNALYGFKTRDDYLNSLRPMIKLDPILMPTRYLDKRSGMVISTGDQTVPSKNQMLLKNILKPKKTIEFESDHFWSIVKAWLFYRKDITQFFSENL